MDEKLSIRNMTRVSLPRLPVAALKDDILGAAYTLSIAFVGEQESRRLNRTYRGKDNSTNVLSFPLDADQGELVLCPAVIRREVREKKFDKDFRALIGFLLIHGMLHLKGATHSSTMEKAEASYDKKYFGGNRRGLGAGARRGRRTLERRKNS